MGIASDSMMTALSGLTPAAMARETARASTRFWTTVMGESEMFSTESTTPDTYGNQVSLAKRASAEGQTHLSDGSADRVSDVEVLEANNAADACKRVRSEDSSSSNEIDW